jgi:ferritin-like metal-binding protein YciE
MDASPDTLAQAVRAKRIALDNDLELLRVRAQSVHPRQAALRWGKVAAPMAAGLAAVWWWQRHRHSIASLQQLLVHGLRELYAAEHAMLPSLERMREQATNRDLASLFSVHLEVSRVHIERLERVFRSVGAKPSHRAAAPVAAMQQEGMRLLKRKADPDVRDALLIAMAQRAEHLEIAGYGTCRTHAATLGYTYAAQLLQETLEEERDFDVQLTYLAERFVNLESIR